MNSFNTWIVSSSQRNPPEFSPWSGFLYAVIICPPCVNLRKNCSQEHRQTDTLSLKKAPVNHLFQLIDLLIPHKLVVNYEKSPNISKKLNLTENKLITMIRLKQASELRNLLPILSFYFLPRCLHIPRLFYWVLTQFLAYLVQRQLLQVDELNKKKQFLRCSFQIRNKLIRRI